MLPPIISSEPQPILVTSLEHSIWIGLHSNLETSLKRLDISRFAEPTMLILHDLLDCAVKELHRSVFLQQIEDDFGITPGGNTETSLDSLYKAEVVEHGSQNIALYCMDNGWHVEVSFPASTHSIVAIKSRVKWDISACKTTKLVEALCYQLEEYSPNDSSESYVVTLNKQADKGTSVRLGGLLDEAASLESIRSINKKLGYGVILFSSAGELIAASRAMLASVQLDDKPDSITSLCAAIPFNFYNDIIWGLALTGQNGAFENYRVRLHLPGEEKLSILFNVSGFRDDQSIIHSLWQVVSLADKGASLTEGSMLSEVRVHKITRSYVPQLVEKKAREAVRLGEDKLTNEECFVAVLFCDIVGFTSYVESNASSESIINTLNTILRRVSGSIKRHNGAIDKFMGDSVMAIFRNPAEAIFAALDMQNHSADINGLRSRAGQDTLQLRIGIHWGEVVIGNVGTAERLDWTAIGDVVNTASRIEKNCAPGSILISKTMRDAVVALNHPEIKFDKTFPLTVKGKREALLVCHIQQP
jgi:class 3 adenylate cyclase